MSHYIIFTDGGTRNTGNQKGQHVKKNDLSAYAYLITKNHHKIASGTEGFYGATNNQMEVMGVIKALLGVIRLSQEPFLQSKSNKNSYKLIGLFPSHDSFTIISDSKYVDNTINQKWLNKWSKNGFKKRKNAMEWTTLLSLLKMFSHINFKWTKGHSSGQTYASKGNIFVDHLLNKTMDKMKE